MSLIFKQFFRGAAIATATAVLVCAQAACMIPQSIDPQTAATHPAPQIDVSKIPSDLLSPPILTLIRQGSADAVLSPPCHCVLSFDGMSVEADPDITLEARWFVDYDASVPASTVSRPDSPFEIGPNRDDPTKTTRNVPTFLLDTERAGIVQSGIHIVEVVIGERDGFDTSPTAPRGNRSMKEGYSSTEYKFVVDVRLEQVAGQCPRTLPSTAVCQ